MYSKACILFGINKDPKLISELIEAYREESISITAKMFLIVLNLCREGNLANEALWVLNKMQEFNIRPDTTSYNVVIRLFCKKSNMDVAAELMREMSLVNLYPDMVTYITMIKGFSNLGKLEEACVLCRVMKEHGCVPNLVAYSALLDGICRFGSLGNALELLREMEREREDCRPNLVTYTTMIQGFCERGRPMEAVSFLGQMKASGFAPNRVTVSVLMKGFCSEGLLEEAYKLIDRAVTEGGVYRGECYSSLVISLIRIGDFREAEKLFQKMLASEIKPDSLASSKMLRELCSKGRVVDAFYLCEEVEKLGYLVSIDSDIYSILLDGLCREQCLAEVIKLLRLCIDKNIKLKAPYIRTVVEYLKKSGKEELMPLLSSSKIDLD